MSFDPHDSLIGVTLDGRYRLERLLGRGGMGAVYEAKNHLGKRFAVKVILGDPSEQSREARLRFVREARAASAITSEHVVTVVDADTDAETGVPFIVMDLLSGQDLDHLIGAVGPIAPTTTVRLFLQACRGLAAAHASSLIHRDIKPANLFLHVASSGNVTVKICDFGIAKTTATDMVDQASHGLTRTGGMLGSPSYMSPEQARNAKHVDSRTDVWSLCMALYEALSAKRPWDHCQTIGELILAICTEELTPLARAAPWLDLELAGIVHRGLRRNLSERWASVDDLAAALRRFSGGSEHVTRDMLVGLSADDRAQLAVRPSMPPSAAPAGSAPFTSGSRSTVGVSNTSPTPSQPKGRGVGAALTGAAVLVGAFVGWKTLGARGPRLDSSANLPPSGPVATLSASAAASSLDPGVARVIVRPTGASVTVDDVPRALEDGALVLHGEPGDTFHVIATADRGRIETAIVLLKGGGAQPSSIEVPTGSAPATSAPRTARPATPPRTAPTASVAKPPAPTTTAPTTPKVQQSWQ